MPESAWASSSQVQKARNLVIRASLARRPPGGVPCSWLLASKVGRTIQTLQRTIARRSRDATRE